MAAAVSSKGPPESVSSREVQALSSSIRTIIVNEIQKLPSLLDEVQNLFDEQPRKWQFFLTGSSARRLRRGRSADLPIWSMVARPSSSEVSPRAQHTPNPPPA
jgi:hypothetical protein